MLTKLPLVLSTLLFSLAAREGRADEPRPTVETRAPAEHGARGEHGKKAHDLCAMLSCTAAQQAKIDGVLGTMREQLKALHGTRGADGKALADAMRDGSLDRGEVIAALGKGDELRAKREGIFADAIVGIYNALDAGQRDQLVKLVETRGAQAVLHGGHGNGRHERGARGDDKGRPTKGKPAKPERRADKADHRADKAQRMAHARVHAPVANVHAFKSRS
jgi:Spy/CpxP family protein refolding chaperone